MGTLGILAFFASMNLFAATEELPKTDETRPSVEEVASTSLRILNEKDPLRRGQTIGLDTPMGRVEVMLLWADAQLQLGTLEEPLDEAVVAFAPAGVFVRKERPTGRVVLSLPVLRF